MRGLRVTVLWRRRSPGAPMACGRGPAEPTPGASDTSSSSITTTMGHVATAAPAGTPATAACDRGEALAAVIASDAAEGGGHIDYLACLDGFGWALYSVSADMDTAHVLLSITTGGYQVLNFGTSLCPRD